MEYVYPSHPQVIPLFSNAYRFRAPYSFRQQGRKNKRSVDKQLGANFPPSFQFAVIILDTLVIKRKTTVVESNITVIKLDTTVIKLETTVIEFNTVVIKLNTTVIKLNTTVT